MQLVISSLIRLLEDLAQRFCILDLTAYTQFVEMPTMSPNNQASTADKMGVVIAERSDPSDALLIARRIATRMGRGQYGRTLTVNAVRSEVGDRD